MTTWLLWGCLTEVAQRKLRLYQVMHYGNNWKSPKQLWQPVMLNVKLEGLEEVAGLMKGKPKSKRVK